METYGVSFEGFQPSCGWPLYKYVEEELIPYLKAEVVRWRERRDEASNERAALKGLKADLEGMMKSRDGLVAKLQAKISGSETKVNDVMPLGVKEAEVETSSTWQALSSWLDESKTTIEQIAFFYKHACERADMSLGLLRTALSQRRLTFDSGSARLNCNAPTGCLRRPSLSIKPKFAASSLRRWPIT